MNAIKQRLMKLEYLNEVCVHSPSLLIDTKAFSGKFIKDTNQNNTDLEKAFEWCIKNKISTINVLGSSQKREDHSFGNLFLLSTYCDLLNLTYVTDYFSITCHKGNKIFGAAILKKSDYSLVCIGTNNEIENPLWHGEISTLKNFYEISSNERINTKDCIFVSTHEPCSLCLSAITWTGFDNIYYFFPYLDTKNKFKIPHDLKILKDVFNIKNGNYNSDNNYWKSYSIINNINLLKEPERSHLKEKVCKIIKIYQNFSNLYQKNKSKNIIQLN